jgi:dTDP-4-amino-4,6-dideoxygalactose transaminase
MPELSAALGLRQLFRLDEALVARRQIASWYDTAIDAMAHPVVHTPPPGPGETIAYYKICRQPAAWDGS